MERLKSLASYCGSIFSATVTGECRRVGLLPAR